MAMDPPPPPARPSGIPRLSRLPVPKPSQTIGADSQRTNAKSPTQPSLRGGESRHGASLASFNTSHQRSFQRSASKTGTLPKLNGTLRNSSRDNDAPQSNLPSHNDISTIPNVVPLEEVDSPIGEIQQPEDDFSDLAPAPTPKARKPRPSLSDRTMETLAHLPPTPGASRRRSGFFSPSSPPETSSRPPSSLNNRRPGSSMSNRRPSTRDGMHSFPRPGSPSKRLTTPVKSTNSARAPTPSKRSVSAEEALSSPSMKSLAISGSVAAKGTQRTSTRNVQGRAGPKFTGSRTIATRSPKPKPALGDVFKKEDTSKSHENSASPKGSAALREQIAKAKAARRAASLKLQANPSEGGNDIDLGEDPFNQLPSNNEQVLKKRINVGRSEGRLDLVAMGLKSIPDAVRSMYDYDPNSDAAWNESVDLVRFVAADNEIEELPDSVFPDINPADTADEEDGKGIQFGGLELLDMHGNLLRSVPLGLRRLERLTTLNLSYNRLGNDTLDVILQVQSLRELKLAHNNFEGTLPDSVAQLGNLETLELQNNGFSCLPDSLKELTKLRVLHLSENNLDSLPLKSLIHLPLVELSASKNKLEGALFPANITSMPKLHKLDISNNSLASLDSGELSLPSLQTLNISCNRITTLPDVSTWKELLSLLAEDNRVSNLPEGLMELRKVKNLDFTGNDLRHLDPRLGFIDSLNILKIAANPMRERKYLSMDTEDIKQDMRSRIEIPRQDTEHEETNVALPGSSGAVESPSGKLALKPGGILDLSSRSLSSLEDTLQSFDSADDVRHLALQHNTFLSIPTGISLLSNLRVLNLAHNKLAALLDVPLFLPQLRDLNLSFNNIASLDSLTTYLVAPELQHFDLSSNRITGSLVTLQVSFPSLSHLHASDNQIERIDAESLKGLKIVNLSNNDIEALDPKIGLLWDEGLKSFEVGGNKFRVPGWRVLEKGTETVMAWLRDRIPEDKA